MSELRFDDQVVCITGAGRGLGAAYARLFAARGAKVVVHDAGVNRDGTGGDAGPAESVAAEIRAAGGEAQVDIQNLSTRDACESLIQRSIDLFGRIDVLVHSAGLVTYTPFAETTDDEWERLLNVNIQAPFWLCRAVWPIMRAQGGGRIVLTVSGYGLKSYEGSDVTAYGVGKGAQFGLMNGLSGEGIAHGIQVNAISPVAATRIFRTEVAPDRFRPEAIAPAVVWLGSRTCPLNGVVIRAAEGRFSTAEFAAAPEIQLTPPFTPEQVADRLTAAS